MNQNISYYCIAARCKNGGCLFNVHARCSSSKCLAFISIFLQPQQRAYRSVTFFQRNFKYLSSKILIAITKSYLISYQRNIVQGKSNEKQCLRKFVFIVVSDIIDLGIQLNVVVCIVVKRLSMLDQYWILDLAFIVLKVIMKM